MPPRSIAAALALVTGACFYDAAPRDPSATFTGTSTAASTDATGPAVTTSATTDEATSAAATSTGAVDPTTSTTDTTTADTTTADATTTMMTSMTMTSMTMPETTTGDPAACGETKLFECYKCCAGAHAGSQLFYATLATCTCSTADCKDTCKDDLCAGAYPTDACLLCAAGMGNSECATLASDACAADPKCAPFLECIAAVPCL